MHPPAGAAESNTTTRADGQMAKVSLAPGEAPTPGLPTVTSSPCPDVAFSWCVPVGGVGREKVRDREGGTERERDGGRETGKSFSSYRTLDLLL